LEPRTLVGATTSCGSGESPSSPAQTINEQQKSLSAYESFLNGDWLAYSVGSVGETTAPGAAVVPDTPGYCYLSLFRPERWLLVSNALGAYPTLMNLCIYVSSFNRDFDPYVSFTGGTMLHLSNTSQSPNPDEESDDDLEEDYISPRWSAVEGIFTERLMNFTVGKKKNKKVMIPVTLPKNAKIKGKGDYSTFFKGMLPTMKDIGTVAAKMLINDTIDPTGTLSNYAFSPKTTKRKPKTMKQKLSVIHGSGDYTTNQVMTANCLFPGATKIPMNSAFDESHGTTVTHRVYLGDLVTGPDAGKFFNTTFTVNPGLLTWFGQIAQLYEIYYWEGLVIEFVTSTSQYASSGAIGTVMITADYNANNPPYVSKLQFENSSNAISSIISSNLAYGVECAENAQNLYYVRTGNSSLPLTSTDLCTIQIATQPASSFPTNSVVGEVWLTGVCKFARPTIPVNNPGYARANSSGIFQSGNFLTTDTNVPSQAGTLYGTTLGSFDGSGNVTLSIPSLRSQDNLTILFYLALTSNDTEFSPTITFNSANSVGCVPGNYIYPDYVGTQQTVTQTTGSNSWVTKALNFIVDGSVPVNVNNFIIVTFNVSCATSTSDVSAFTLSCQVTDLGYGQP
jgi:hypothetical protein